MPRTLWAVRTLVHGGRTSARLSAPGRDSRHADPIERRLQRVPIPDRVIDMHCRAGALLKPNGCGNAFVTQYRLCTEQRTPRSGKPTGSGSAKPNLRKISVAGSVSGSEVRFSTNPMTKHSAPVIAAIEASIPSLVIKEAVSRKNTHTVSATR